MLGLGCSSRTICCGLLTGGHGGLGTKEHLLRWLRLLVQVVTNAQHLSFSVKFLGIILSFEILSFQVDLVCFEFQRAAALGQKDVRAPVRNL